MTRNALATVPAVLFVVLTTLIVMIPIPYVVRSPGEVYDIFDAMRKPPAISISGTQTYQAAGQLLLSASRTTPPYGTLSLPEALFRRWQESAQIVPEGWVYQPGKTREQLQAESSAQVNTTHQDAIVAALRAAGKPVTEMPMVATVAETGPAFGRLFVGDLIAKVDGIPVHNRADIATAIQRHAVGEDVVFEVLRGNHPVAVTVTTASSNQGDRRIPVYGVSTTIGYRYDQTVTFRIDPEVDGKSAGLGLALGLYNLLTPKSLLGDQAIGVTGEITPGGKVKAVSAVKEKVAAAQNKVTGFIIPAANCVDLAGFKAKTTIVPVHNLAEAISAIKNLGSQSSHAEVPHC